METQRSDVTTSDLQSEAHAAAGNLVRAELALVRKEFQEEIQGLRTSAISFGVAGVTGLLGAFTLLETLIVSDITRSRRGLLAGSALLSLASVSAFWGYQALPKHAVHRVAGDLQPSIQVFE